MRVGRRQPAVDRRVEFVLGVRAVVLREAHVPEPHVRLTVAPVDAENVLEGMFERVARQLARGDLRDARGDVAAILRINCSAASVELVPRPHRVAERAQPVESASITRAVGSCDGEYRLTRSSRRRATLTCAATRLVCSPPSALTSYNSGFGAATYFH